MSNYDLTYEISKARTRLVSRAPFFGYLAMQLRPRKARPEDGVPTAGIAPDGTVIVNEEFASKLKPQELAGVLAHEVMHCFPAGTLVMGDDKPIETFRVGDETLGASGQKSRVVATGHRHYDGALVTLKARGLLPVEVTTEHPILVTRPRWRRVGPKRGGTNIRVWSEPKWKKAEEVEKNDWVLVPRIQGADDVAHLPIDASLLNRPNKQVALATLVLDEEFAQAIGRYVADGYSPTLHGDVNGDVHFSIGKDKKAADAAWLVEMLTRRLGYVVQSIDTGHGALDVRLRCKPLAVFFRDYCGAGAHNKKIPEFILYHKDECILRAFLKGYMAGDGYVTNVVSFGTVSRTLALQLQLAFARLGTLINLHERAATVGEIHGRTIQSGISYVGTTRSQAAFDAVSVNRKVKRPTQYFGLLDGHIATPVTDTSRREFHGEVYNLETENHTYSAGNIVTHNCALHFWARKGSRNHLLFNIAHDVSYNFIITEMAKGEIELPDGALLDPKFQGMSAEEIYGYLLKGDPKTPGKTKIACKGGGSITIDVNGGGGEDYGDCREDLSESETGQKAAKGDDAAQRKLTNEWKLSIAGAVQQHEARKTQGKLPAALQRFIDELLHPTLDWAEQLARWCGENGKKDEYSFARPNRRSDSIGSVLPSQCAGGFSDVTLFIDTSGSIGQDRLKRVLGEIQGVCEEMGSEIRVIIIDADVHDDITVEDAIEVGRKLTGGGGSDLNPAFARLDEEGYDGAVIVFTDGYISVPEEMPVNLKGVLWVLEEGEKAPTEKYGDAIYVPSDDKLDLDSPHVHAPVNAADDDDDDA